MRKSWIATCLVLLATAIPPGPFGSPALPILGWPVSLHYAAMAALALALWLWDAWSGRHGWGYVATRVVGNASLAFAGSLWFLALLGRGLDRMRSVPAIDPAVMEFRSVHSSFLYFAFFAGFPALMGGAVVWAVSAILAQSAREKAARAR